jgi:hypothetical protein
MVSETEKRQTEAAQEFAIYRYVHFDTSGKPRPTAEAIALAEKCGILFDRKTDKTPY